MTFVRLKRQAVHTIGRPKEAGCPYYRVSNLELLVAPDPEVQPTIIMIKGNVEVCPPGI